MRNTCSINSISSYLSACFIPKNKLSAAVVAISTLSAAILAGTGHLPALTSMHSYLSTISYAGTTYVGVTIIANVASSTLSKTDLTQKDPLQNLRICTKATERAFVELANSAKLANKSTGELPTALALLTRAQNLNEPKEFLKALSNAIQHSKSYEDSIRSSASSSAEYYNWNNAKNLTTALEQEKSELELVLRNSWFSALC